MAEIELQARSRIEDADFAAETARDWLGAQILQAGWHIKYLAQAK